MNYKILELEQMIEAVSIERKIIKEMMKIWVNIVNKFVPFHKTGGRWVARMSVCSKSKSCPDCPHGLHWRKMYRLKYKEKQEHHSEYFLIWGNKKEDTCLNDLPPNIAKDIKCSYKTRQAYQAFEHVRKQIVEHHTQCSLISRKLKARLREENKRDNKLNLLNKYEHKANNIAETILHLLNSSSDRKDLYNQLLNLEIKYPPRKESF